MNPQRRSYRIYLEDIESSMLKILEYIGKTASSNLNRIQCWWML